MSKDKSSNPPFEASPEHQFLAEGEGTWKVSCSYAMGGDAAPLEVEGEEKAEMLEPFWLVTRFEADLLGSPMFGHGSTGYDPVRKLYIATWKDSSNPFLYTFEGFFDEADNTLKLSGENYDPMRGVRSIYRSHIEYLSDDEKRLKLSVEIAGGEINEILEYSYKRV